MNLDLSKMLPMGALILGVWIAGVGFGYVDALGLGPLSVAFFAVALIAFLGSLRAGADMRTAITAAFVVGYFSLFAALATSATNQEQFDTVVGQEIWDNFTYLVGVIVLFYFGATAAVEITKHITAAPGSNAATDTTATTTRPAVAPDAPAPTDSTA